MKKFIYFCGMMFLSLNMMAQIDLDDQNWRCRLNEDFTTPGRYWIDTSWISSDSVWKAYSSNVIHGDYAHHNKMVYHYKQCHFNDVDGYMELVAEYDSLHSIPAHNYTLPYTLHSNYPTYSDLYYFSGRIDHFDTLGPDSAKYQYGYFEIRCKLPIHRGAFPAFWLYAANKDQHYYEEIDIFEYSWGFEDTLNNLYGNPHPHGVDNPYCFTSGIYYCDTANYNGHETSQARVFPMINDSLSHWHRFSCEWMPEHILWYCDGKLVDEYHNPDSIPHHPLTLKANYAVDKYALEDYHHWHDPAWKGQDTMLIDYIKVYQLAWDCDADEVITRQSELNHFDFAVKKSIVITSTFEAVKVESTDKMTFRATESFEITGPFQVDIGGEMTVIMQQCPE